MSLVLDWVDGTLGSPVDGVGEVGDIEDLNVLGEVSVSWHLESEELLVLVMSPGGELVVSNGEGVSLLGVDLLDLLVLLGEELHSEGVLLLGSIGLSEGSDVLVEGGLDTDLLLAVMVLDSEESSGFAKVKHVVCLV